MYLIDPLDLANDEQYLVRKNITDLSALAELLAKVTRPKILDLSFNQITDISPLAELERFGRLGRLDISDNPITDRTPLAGLERLVKTQSELRSLEIERQRALLGI